MLHRAPGHPQSLTVTMNPPSPSAAQQPTATSPPQQQQQPYPSYPLPIPPEKQAKALQLYKQYKLEKTLSQQPQSAISNHHGFHLSVPGPLPPRSTTSVGSSRHHRALSISTSAYDATTDLSSVVSFDDNESLTSRGRHDELMSFDGKKIRQRRRSKLNPTKRAKAALVRCLGSCWVCRSRRVPCPLEHHDIASLEQLWKASEGPRSSPPHKASSSGSIASQKTTTFPALKQESESTASQSDALVGIGGDLQLLDDYSKFDTTLDIQSLIGAEERRAQNLTPARINLVASNLAILDPTPYSRYQNGGMVAIGVYRRGLFYCQHLDGGCQQFFDEAELLQLHFELFHFQYTRIDPPIRYICSADHCLNENTSGPCLNCGAHNTIEPWIYGQYIQSSTLDRHSPDAQPVQEFDALQLPYSQHSFPSQNIQWENDMGPFTDFNDNGNFDFQNSNLFDGSPYDFDASHGSDNGDQSPANTFGGGARYSSRGNYCAPLKPFEAPERFYLHLSLSAVMCLMLLVLILFGLAQNWILSGAYTALNTLAHFPAVRFISLLGSFTRCLSSKHLVGKIPPPTYLRSLKLVAASKAKLACRETSWHSRSRISIWT